MVIVQLTRRNYGSAYNFLKKNFIAKLLLAKVCLSIA